MTQPILMRDKIISFVKANGPVLPYQIAKVINENMIIASAHLSEMVASGILKISSLKVGGSPLYYAPGQEHLLQKYSQNLHEKDRKAYELLSQKRILEDTSLEPLTRVALREIKDFAVPIKVTQNDKVYLFWRWYLANDNEVRSLINSYFESLILKKEKITEAEETKKNTGQSKQEQTVLKQKELIEPMKDSFYNSITDFFKKSKINVLSFEIIKKNSEMDFVIEVPSAFGDVTYYCKTKNKKRISDSDLTNAYVAGQLKKLPVVFLCRGELSKKAENILKNLSGLTFMKLPQ